MRYSNFCYKSIQNNCFCFCCTSSSELNATESQDFNCIMQFCVYATTVISSLVFCCTIVSQNVHPLCFFTYEIWFIIFCFSILSGTKLCVKLTLFYVLWLLMPVQAANQQIEIQLHPAQVCWVCWICNIGSCVTTVREVQVVALPVSLLFCFARHIRPFGRAPLQNAVPWRIHFKNSIGSRWIDILLTKSQVAIKKQTNLAEDRYWLVSNLKHKKCMKYVHWIQTSSHIYK